METYPERWYEYISVTTESDTEWKDQTPHAGPPLLYVPNPKQTEDDGLKDRCFISLTSPILINIASEVNMDLGRLSGSALCRLIQAYMYSQHQHKQKTYEEFGEWANLPDPEEWWANKDPVWKLREAKMNNKLPVVVDKKTNVYRLE
ncbi:unnamed protein product [Aureobasidium mustum]|uniref:Uncharacterized protein n=1 Tax=Aureobasidium mustum TaxID=2773714 RepID=A0A9N8PHB1_9PEZI|nr:unnamed protein product [Aureobasidium mustum]